MVRRQLAADASFAAILALSKLGMAIAAMTRMIATTINNSISENPRFVCFGLVLISLAPTLHARLTPFIQHSDDHCSNADMTMVTVQSIENTT
jgi:hypothetical protein